MSDCEQATGQHILYGSNDCMEGLAVSVKQNKCLQINLMTFMKLSQDITLLVSQGLDTQSGNILSFLLPLFQEGQLSVTGESMCTKYWLTA